MKHEVNPTAHSMIRDLTTHHGLNFSDPSFATRILTLAESLKKELTTNEAELLAATLVPLPATGGHALNDSNENATHSFIIFPVTNGTVITVEIRKKFTKNFYRRIF